MLRTIVALFLLLGVLPLRAADPGACFLKNGDKWLLIGDSITNTDTYRQLIVRTLQHYHPAADIRVGSSAVNGVTSDFKEQREFTPTVVTVMLGINDVIHEDWSFTPDVRAKVAGYRQNMTAIARKYKPLGAEVIFMTPTYPDERFSTAFNVAMTRRFLEAYGQVIREVAAAEGCHWLPVAEEMEAYQDTLGIDQHLRHDGVHPTGLGQYQIARTFWTHMNFAGALTGSRKFVTPAKPLAATVRLGSRFMHQPADGVSLIFSAPETTAVTVQWSLGAARGSAPLAIGPAGTSWQVPVPAAELTLPVGAFKRMVVELVAGAERKLCVIDLARTRVLKLTNGTVSGEIQSAVARPEGPTVATWTIEDTGKALWFSGEVRDTELAWDGYFPFQRDSVMFWLDLRPAERFAGIGLDRDVADLILAVRDQPGFCVAPVPWVGPRLIYATWAGGEKTAGGYKWRCGLEGKVSDVRGLGLDKRDYFGIGLIVCDQDSKPTRSWQYHPAQKLVTGDLDNYPNLMMIVDRKGVFPGEETTNLHLFQ
jgi:lysophospholipase L1-like esterase